MKPRYLSTHINYHDKDKAIAALQELLTTGADAVLSKDGLSISILQDTPVQSGQCEFIGDRP